MSTRPIVPSTSSPAPMVIDHGPNLAAIRGPRIDIVVKVRASGPCRQGPVQRRLAQAGLEKERQHEHEAAEEEQQGEVQGRPWPRNPGRGTAAGRETDRRPGG